MNNPNHDIAKDSTGSDLLTSYYLGKIIDVDDPLREGRCKIQVFSIFDGLDADDIPWATQIQKPAFFGQDAKAGAISIPKKGAIVGVRFNNGDLYSPEYTQVQELGDDIKEQLKKGDVNEYEGSHYILWDGDEQIKIWFNTANGLSFQMKDSYVNIDQNSKIEIYHKDGLSSIELDGNVITVNSQSQVNVISNSITASAENIWLQGNTTRVGSSDQVESAVMGDSLFAALMILAAAIDEKMPSTPGATQAMMTSMMDSILSETVTIGH